MDQKDAKLLGAVYSLLLEHGALSEEKALSLLVEERKNSCTLYMGQFMSQEIPVMRDIHWAFFQLDCKEGGGLWTLPDEKLPVNERSDPHPVAQRLRDTGK